MKVKGAIFFFMALFISFCSYAENATKNNFPQTLKLAGQDWKIGFQNEDTNMALLEYVIDRESVDNWTQLFTYQRFKLPLPKEITPNQFADKEMANLKAKGYKYDYKIIKATPQEAIIEFRILSPIKDQQDEIQRLLKASDNTFVVLHYAVKKSDMGKDLRVLWLKTLENLNLSQFK